MTTPPSLRPNPFSDDLARAQSTYAAFNGDRLVRVHEPQRAVPPVTALVHDTFRALVMSPHFSCAGAKAAVGSGAYRFGLYGEMGSAEATAGLARDLYSFVEEQPRLGSAFSTFVASFSGPVTASEEDFEAALWRQLQALHDADRAHHEWDPTVSDDPDDPSFSFSFATRAFFVIGLHPASSRWARRFGWPTLVFNAHHQFERLRERGAFEPLRDAIRERDVALQGYANAMMSDFGNVSEARQYSGRAVGDDWRCPFSAGGHTGERE